MSKFSDVSPVELAAVASVLSDPARLAVLIALLDGRSRTASELALIAGVTPQTASSHLAKLVDGGLIVVAKQGRHRYHHLARPEAARALEALTELAAGPQRRPRVPGPRDPALREARTCYDHFAGRFGVAIVDALHSVNGLIDNGRDFEITAEGEARLSLLRVEVKSLRADRRPLCRRCIDWSERRPHLAGLVGARLTSNCLSSGWVERIADTRAVRLTHRGRKVFADALDMKPTDF